MNSKVMLAIGVVVISFFFTGCGDDPVSADIKKNKSEESKKKERLKVRYYGQEEVTEEDVQAEEAQYTKPAESEHSAGEEQ